VSLNLSRFKSMKKSATRTVISGSPNDENNYEQQPIKPVTDKMEAKKKDKLTLEPYSMMMLTYEL
jgi:alpha-L-arabinofuranosidase